MPSPRFRIELFGAARVLRDAAEVRLPVKKSLALLAYVAIERRATRAKLAALLWGESGGEAARRNLRRELHRLREAGCAEALAIDDEAVALAPGAGCDVVDFLAALAAHDRVAALAAWRGPLMDGFDLAESEEFDRWLVVLRDDLTRQFCAAAQAHAVACEAAGDARGALALHARLMAHDPLQESHYTSAMRLHYLLGERGRALELYERCRATLMKELGLQPLPETAALAERIRAADQMTPLAAASAAAGVTQFAPPLVGRAAELARLAGGPIVSLLTGEPGVGKSRLADECTRGAGGRVRIAGAELGRAAPLFPVIETLARLAAEPHARGALVSLPAGERTELIRLLPALDPDAPASTEDDEAPPAAKRMRLLDALASALIVLAGEAPLWIDDLHWLDEMTLDLVHHLAHRLGRERRKGPRIVITARKQELADNPFASGAMLRLERAQLLQRIELAPLDTAATTELVRRLSGARDGRVFAERLQRATRGNPFFLLETLRFLFDSGELTLDPQGNWSTRYDEATGDYAELPVPPTVQQAVLERVERLGPAARRVLETAALAGDGFKLDEVQPATALSDWEALEGLERASGASLVVGVERSYRFAHDLVRLALDRSLGAERRRLIHLRLAESLIAQGGRPDRIARHFDDAGAAAQGAPWHLAAARAAERVFAHGEAIAHYGAALAATEDPAARVALHLARAELLRVQHDLPAVQAELDRLDALAQELDRPVLAAEVLVRRARLAIAHQRYAPAVEYAQQAAAHPGFVSLPQTLREDALLAGAFGLVEEGHYDAARAIYDRELASPPPHRPRYLGELHRGMANLLTSYGADAEAGVHLHKAADLLAQAGDFEGQTRSLNILAYTQHVTGDTPGAIATMERALADAERLHAVHLQRNTLLNFVIYCLHSGDFARARAQVDRAADVLRYADDAATQARLQIRIAEVNAADGDLGAALPAARKSLQLIEDNGGGLPDFWPWFLLATLLWRCGDGEAAAGVYRSLPDSRAWLVTAAPAVALFPTVYRLPGNAREALAALPAIAPARGVLCDPEAIAYYTAYAHHALGEHDAALRALCPQGVLIAPSPFALHAASVAALHLSIACATGRPEPAVQARAATLLTRAPAFESIELRAALARAARAAGAAAEAAEHGAAARATIERLAASLHATPELARSLRRFWSSHLQRSES